MNGYILISKAITDSDIWHKPPIYVKVWLYLLRSAMYANDGHLKRGQLFTSIQEIAEACSYHKGYQKVTPSKHEIYTVIEYLRKTDEGNDEGNTNVPMIVTTKVTHGMLVTICNYNKYQDPRFYEGNNESNNESNTNVTTRRQRVNNIKNEYKENKKEKNIERDMRESSDSDIFALQHKQFADIKARLAGMEA